MVKYVLFYHQVRGLGETIRLIFHYTGTEFEDKRLTQAQWDAMKPLTPWGQLPILKVDQKQLSQSSAIYHYLGKKFDLAGKDDWEEALVQSIVQAQKDFGTECNEFFAVALGKQQGDKEELFDCQFKPAADKYIPPLERQLKEAGSGYFVPSGLTYLDFFVAEYVDTLNALFPAVFKRFPLLLEHTKRVHALPQLQTYLAKRPKTAV